VESSADFRKKSFTNFNTFLCLFNTYLGWSD